MPQRFIGVDMGAETIKIVELSSDGQGLEWVRGEMLEHHKQPAQRLLDALQSWSWEGVTGAAVCGRLARSMDLPRVPTQQALAHGFRFFNAEESRQTATLVSIGSHGFSVLELRDNGVQVFRENSRCSQGTGNFLRQLVERFNLTIEEASKICESITEPAPLSGRCPVILKTDMTHLANVGESKPRILAGLFDAVAENVQVLIKPRSSPPRTLLLGGVSRSPRIRRHFREFLRNNGMELAEMDLEQSLFIEAMGAAVVASLQPRPPAPLRRLLKARKENALERLPPLAAQRNNVRRMKPRPLPLGPTPGKPRPLLLGFDIGSTGSKAVAIDAQSAEPVWKDYVQTLGDPVGAAQKLMALFLDSPWGVAPVLAMGATGSGREIVGSLASCCYGPASVYVLNEIAAHARGALQYDPRVDTIFEIGGQDAKYIRLADGRVVDAAMNEACSAGTGSFIEEQGRRFATIEDVTAMGREALRAPAGVSLGQHCSVFMAEVIDDAVAMGVPQAEIVAGIFDSVIQNYLNRVKGSRSVGEVIFCQGMPFSSTALAAAVARQTESEVVVPPDPGITGALGIALLTLENLDLDQASPMEPRRFLEARVEARDIFVCRSTKGCGGAGNRCRINRISTVVDEQRARFTWGGGCSLHDRGTGREKLPDRAPDPFRERLERTSRFRQEVTTPRGRPRVGMTDEFLLKGLFPFFATFIRRLGFDPVVLSNAGTRALKRGIEEANVPYCAPMQLYHGIVAELASAPVEFLFLPMLRTLPRVGTEPHAVICPIAQASADLLTGDLGKIRPRVISPIMDFGPGNLRSAEFRQSCLGLARALGVEGREWLEAFNEAILVQEAFDSALTRMGRRALDFARAKSIVPVVVHGRSYTIYNNVLNSNVPNILREQGAMAIPVDCYPVDDSGGPGRPPVFQRMYWGYGQRNLRVAHRVRRTPGIYSLWCSNYACGPDSFNLHFYSYIMNGRPYSIIETDGHSGDAGTRTRVEAFLYCAREDLQRQGRGSQPSSFLDVEKDQTSLPQVKSDHRLMLIPRMGQGAEAMAACMRGIGIRAETMPIPDTEALRLGRRHTSGKECVPMTITLGSLLQRLEREPDPQAAFTLVMARANGPCRFGAYNLLHKIILERLGLQGRVKVWSPSDNDYFREAPPAFALLLFSGFMAMDLLLEALYDVRPRELHPAVAQEIHDRYTSQLLQLLENAAGRDLSLPMLAYQVAGGRLFGIPRLLERAAREFRANRQERDMPTALLVGEIYVRCDPFANGFMVDKLEQRGIKVRFAPFNEWLEYVEYLYGPDRFTDNPVRFLRGRVQDGVRRRLYGAMARNLDWPRRTTVPDSLRAASSYLRDDLRGEAALTIGGPVFEWREGLIDGVVSVGPLECMPSKIAEAHLFHAKEREGLPSLCLSLNGDPLETEALDNFAFEIHQRFRARSTGSTEAPSSEPVGRLKRVDQRVTPTVRKTPASPLPLSTANSIPAPPAGAAHHPGPRSRGRPFSKTSPS